MLGQPNTSCWL